MQLCICQVLSLVRQARRLRRQHQRGIEGSWCRGIAGLVGTGLACLPCQLSSAAAAGCTGGLAGGRQPVGAYAAGLEVEVQHSSAGNKNNECAGGQRWDPVLPGRLVARLAAAPVPAIGRPASLHGSAARCWLRLRRGDQ